jgi:hypothetical protein
MQEQCPSALPATYTLGIFSLLDEFHCREIHREVTMHPKVQHELAYILLIELLA